MTEAPICVLQTDGCVVCWGTKENELFVDDDYGQTDVPEGHRFIDVASENRATCGLTDAHEVVCWGC